MERTTSVWRFLVVDRRRFWKNVFFIPLYWLFLCFFQPTRFSEQFEYRTIDRRFALLVKLAIPLFLLVLLIALPIQGLFPCTAFCTLSPVFMWNMLSAIFLATLLGVICGLLVGVLDNVGLGIILSIALGATGVILGHAARGEARGIAFAVIAGLVTGTAKGLQWRMWRGMLAAILSGLPWIIGSISVTSVPESVTRGALVASVFFGCYIIGYYRLLLYLFSGLSGLQTYIASKRNPTTAFLNLDSSSLHWDECVFLPLPLLRRTLLIAFEQNAKKALDEIAFIAKGRPQQIHAAKMVATEIALQDLQGRKTMHDIARVSQRLNEIFPQEVLLSASASMIPFTNLRKVSIEAERYIGHSDWQTKCKALETMRLILNKIYPDTAFSNAKLNTLLANITNQWRFAIGYEQDKLDQEGEIVGEIINPYSPGNPLKPNDTLFVGRRDVVRQLSQSLSQPNRPTFLLNGERRMGKSSTLRQLPGLLGTSYIPVRYDLQSPGIYNSIEALLTEIAKEIYETAHLRGIHIERLKYSRLHDARQKNEAAVYQPFDVWLDGVERILQHEKCTLLLLFDEFEKLEEARKADYLNLNLLLDWFRNTVQNRSYVALLFSGVNTFSEIGKNWAGYFVNAKTVRVSFLKPAEARDLITKPVPNFPSQQLFTADIVEEIIRVTACHPFLVQAVCSELINNLNYKNRKCAEMSDVADAVAGVLESRGNHFHDLWLRTDQQQRTCLMLLSKRGASDASVLAAASSLDEQSIRQVLHILLKRDLVIQEQQSYRIAAPILQEWIIKHEMPNS